MANIYQLTEDVLQLHDVCLDPDLEVSDEDFEHLMEASFSAFGELDEKYRAYAKLIKNLTAEAEAIKSEKQLLAKRQSAVENKVERLKRSLQESMAVTGTMKVGGIPSITIAKSPDTIDRERTDAGKVAEDWLKPPKEREVDSKKIMAHYKETGEVPEGVAIATGRTSLRIR